MISKCGNNPEGKIRLLYDTGFVSKHSIACLAIGLYQFTRPFIFEESYYFNESKRMGRHKIVNKYLVNFIKKHSKIYWRKES